MQCYYYYYINYTLNTLTLKCSFKIFCKCRWLRIENCCNYYNYHAVYRDLPEYQGCHVAEIIHRSIEIQVLVFWSGKTWSVICLLHECGIGDRLWKTKHPKYTGDAFSPCSIYITFNQWQPFQIERCASDLSAPFGSDPQLNLARLGESLLTRQYWNGRLREGGGGRKMLE